jgi:hypothetical protein
LRNIARKNVKNPQSALWNFASADGVQKSCAINVPFKGFPILLNMLNKPDTFRHIGRIVLKVKQAVEVQRMPFFAELRPTIVSLARSFEDIDTQSC